MDSNNTESKINKIFSSADKKYGISLFKKEEIDHVNDLIIEEKGELKIKCQIRNEYELATPEEVVRQLWIYRLLTHYGYPKKIIEVEKYIQFGSRVGGYADIVILKKDNLKPYIIFEVKRPERHDGFEQLESYCNATGASIGVWSNGNEYAIYERKNQNNYIEINDIPKDTENVKDVSKRRTFKWLEENDKIKKGETTLLKALKDLEERVLGNAGVDPFEEIFKLIYAKLYDEWKGINDPSYYLEFFVGERNPEEVKKAITNLFEGAKKEWKGVFEDSSEINIRAEHLKECVPILENIKLFNSNLRIIDDAFEYLIPQTSKKKEGQFFTPRPVEDMCIKMLNPKIDEFIIDPACGSAGFLLHSLLWIDGSVTSGKPLEEKAKRFSEHIYGIDISDKAVKVAKAINLIAGDGKSHIFKDNSLAPQTWSDTTKAGLRDRLLTFPNDSKETLRNKEDFMYFDFDLLLTNPPFAGTVAEENILKLYKLAEKNNKTVGKIGRHILFLERSLHFIRPGGRLAIVLPQGLLNNTKAEYIRRFIINEARILAVVGLHENTFKPYTGTKTSVLFLRKYTEEEKEKIRQIRAKYEGEWEKFIKNIKEKYKNLSWNSSINEEEIPEDLISFLESYFGNIEEDKELSGKEELDIEEENYEESGIKNSVVDLVNEKSELEKNLIEKEKDFKRSNSNMKIILKKEIRTLHKKINNLNEEILQSTLAGQISLVLSNEKIIDEFKKYWLDGKVMKEMDYPIFFAVNEKPVKDESGEYRYKKNPDGSFVLDEHGHPVIDHDLDEIAEEFIKIAKEQLAKGDNYFDFWR